MTGGLAPRVPWRDGDLVAVTGTALVGMLAIVAGWFGASGSPAPASQMLWLNIALAGFAVFAIGNCLWLMRLRRAVGERRVGLVSFEVAEEEVEEMPQDAIRAAHPAGRPALPASEWVRGVGMSRVHRPDCPLVVGKQVERARAGDGQLCGVCADG